MPSLAIRAHEAFCVFCVFLSHTACELYYLLFGFLFMINFETQILKHLFAVTFYTMIV